LSFDTRATARGTRLPVGRLHRLLNTITARQIRRSGQIMGFDCLILITVGGKSGLQRTNPVGWFPGPDNSWLIVAAAAGAAKNPSWYYNIAAPRCGRCAVAPTSSCRCTGLRRPPEEPILAAGSVTRWDPAGG
jgi:deazaflavin-dependent oxidoreductase (nitroreductase family)